MTSKEASAFLSGIVKKGQEIKLDFFFSLLQYSYLKINSCQNTDFLKIKKKPLLTYFQFIAYDFGQAIFGPAH